MNRVNGTIQPAKIAGQLNLRGLFETAKPTLTGMSVLTALCAFYVASGTFDVSLFLWTVLGLLLTGSSAGALNQFVERNLDALMRRTERRPLPSGRLNPIHVVVFGIALGIAGLAILFVKVNLLSGLLGAFTLFLYLIVYTPLKRKTQLATIVGAIPGALPPLIGWVAASGNLEVGGLLFFLLLYCWQLPHFLSLGYLYRKDYQRAGFQIGAAENGGGLTRLGASIAGVILVPVSLGLYLEGTVSAAYGFGVAALGVVMAATSLNFAVQLGKRFDSSSQVSNRSARRLFVTSLLYLPSVMILLILGKH